jgi:uncharacterized membrane protein
MCRVRFLLAHRLKTNLWAIPFACALAGIGLSLVTVWIDRSVDEPIIPTSITGDPNAALTILSTVAASMVSLTALVLTITSVVVQLAIGQFSPRSIRPFLEDRPSQFAIGVFVGAFAHAMFAMREVHSFSRDGSVPGVTIVVSYALIFISVVVLVAYVDHIASSLKVDSIIESVSKETRRLHEKLYAREESLDGSRNARDVITADRAGVVFKVDREALVKAATDADVTLTMPSGVGAFVPEGAALFHIAGDRDGLDVVAVRRAVVMGSERTMDEDGTFGVQTLVDIAERSLTESFNDQTTASQVVDRLHDILLRLAPRRFPSGHFRDGGGTLRLVLPEAGWDDYVRVALDDISLAAARSPAVMQRIREVLQDLVLIVPPDRREALEIRLRNLPADPRLDSHDDLEQAGRR